MIYLAASIIIIAINVVPAFMPPTWSVISFLYIRYDLNLLIITIAGASSSVIGRFVLARLSRSMVPHVFSSKVTSNLKFLGEKMTQNKAKIFIISFLWALSPVASNPLFIATGFSSVRLRYVLGGFFVGRLINYSLLAYTSNIVVKEFEETFLRGSFDLIGILIQIIGIVLIFLYVGIDWQELILSRKFKFTWKILKRN